VSLTFYSSKNPDKSIMVSTI